MHRDVFIEDRRTARSVARIQDPPGEELFEWRDEHGRLHPITADHVNEYLRGVSGGDFTSKDFRRVVVRRDHGGGASRGSRVSGAQ